MLMHHWSDEPDVKDIPPRLKQKKFNEEAHLWHQIIVTYLDPVQHDTTLSHSTAITIWALMEEKKINLLRVIKDVMHKMFHVPQAARYIPYGDRDEWGIHLKKRKKSCCTRYCKSSAELTIGARTFRDSSSTHPDFDISQLEPVTPEHEPPSAERSEEFMDAEGGEDDDQDLEGGVDEAEYAPYRRVTKPKEHPADSTDTASEE
ncbi:hypothetical protein PIB30_076560 [Stylosanthes scabra]|uniref:Uncharacterized protein n=1 Tax=Stylosanthes scabra TaxID=79078 RepID=A0ABU6YMV3_9FABA|nr:hypothetical protein [Stylosanthes scabra]